MKMRLSLCILLLLLTTSFARAGLFSNKNIELDVINCRLEESSEYKLVLAKLLIEIWYGHNDVDLFHPVEALSFDASQTFQLDVLSDGYTNHIKVPALSIPLPNLCPDPAYSEETLRKVSFEMQLYFRSQQGEYELVRISPHNMKSKKQIKFARSKKLTKKLKAIFGSIKADLTKNEFSIASPKTGVIFPDLVKDPQVINELQQMEKASRLYDY